MASNLIELAIYNLLLNELRAFVQGFPNDDVDEEIDLVIPNSRAVSRKGIYLKTVYVPADTRGPCVGRSLEFRGTQLVNIVVPRNTGLVKAMTIGACLADYFHQGRILFNDQIVPPLKIKIDRQTNIRPALYEDTEVMIPVLIKYRSFY